MSHFLRTEQSVPAESKVSLRLEISHAVLPNFFMQKFRPFGDISSSEKLLVASRPSAAPPTNGSRNMLPVASAAEARRQAPGENPQMRPPGHSKTLRLWDRFAFELEGVLGGFERHCRAQWPIWPLPCNLGISA